MKTTEEDYRSRLEGFDLDELDNFERMQYEHHVKSMGKVEALEVIVNTVEGSFSQLSEGLRELAEEHFDEEDFDVEL